MTKFIICPKSREIICNSEVEINQNDHASTDIIFIIPEIAAKEELRNCNHIEIHYTNIDCRTGEKKKGTYKPIGYFDDEVPYFVWKIKSNSTQYAGFVNFSITFIEKDKSGNIKSLWSTDMCERKISVSAAGENSDVTIGGTEDEWQEKYNEAYEQLNALLTRTVTSFVIPDYITKVGNFAFAGWMTLENITFPKKLKELGQMCFCMCGFRELTLPEGLEIIGEGAFSSCENLESISIPDSVVNIGERAFESCESLTSLVVPKNVKIIPEEFVCNCNNLTKIILPNGITSIGDNAFEDCTSLESINIPNTVTSIGGYAFYSCVSLKLLTIPEGVVTIGQNIFANCSALETIIFPDTLTSIGDNEWWGLFSQCENLVYLRVPKGYSESLYLSYNSKLTIECRCDIIENLADMTGKTSPKIVFASDCRGIDSTHLEMLKEKNWEHNCVLDMAIPDTEVVIEADYSSVEDAIAQAPENLSGYTYASSQALYNAIHSVNWELSSAYQHVVDSYAQAILEAIANLEYSNEPQ